MCRARPGAPGVPGADGALQPLPRQQRIGAVDVLRGFALLGVVVVNTQAFAGHIPPPPGTLADQVAAWLVAWLLTAKSYSLFSLLFGLGFAIQMERAEARGQDFVPFFRRRCLILFLIGVANAVLLFEGDILTLYAILGLALLLFRRSAPATLVRWAVGLLVLAVAFNLMGALVFASGPQAAGGAGGGSRAPRRRPGRWSTAPGATSTSSRPAWARPSTRPSGSWCWASPTSSPCSSWASPWGGCGRSPPSRSIWLCSGRCAAGGSCWGSP